MCLTCFLHRFLFLLFRDFPERSHAVDFIPVNSYRAMRSLASIILNGGTPHSATQRTGSSDQGQQPPPGHQCSAQDANQEYPEGKKRNRQDGQLISAHRMVPRPVTVKQLLAAARGRDAGLISASLQHHNSRGAGGDDSGCPRSMIGESTMLIDDRPSASVTLCGHLCEVIGPAANGSLRSGANRPFSLLTIEDNTGRIGVVLRHTLCQEYPEWDDCDARGPLDSCEGAPLQSFSYIPEEELQWSVGSLLVVTGRLCFSDVEPRVSKWFGHLSPCNVSSMAASCQGQDQPDAGAIWAAEESAVPSHQPQLSFHKSASAAPVGDAATSGGQRGHDPHHEGVDPPGEVHVLLPAAGAPVPLSSLASLGMTASSVPVGTHFVRPRAPTCDCRSVSSSGNTGTPYQLSHCTPPAHTSSSLALAEPAHGIVCISSNGPAVRAAWSSNEAFYWWLSAILTYLRLTQGGQRPGNLW